VTDLAGLDLTAEHRGYAVAPDDVRKYLRSVFSVKRLMHFVSPFHKAAQAAK
jgi:hypothetical protein